MTIYQRLKVWSIKGWRLIIFGFKKTRQRTTNTIFLQPVIKECDYCHMVKPCVVIEADYEVFVTICADNLRQALSVLESDSVVPTAPVAVPQDHRGVVQ